MSRRAPRPHPDDHRRLRWFIILSLVVLSGISHWIMPISEGRLHLVHLLFRKAFVLPIVLAAIWFELRGGVLTAILVTLIYAPHILLQWPGQPAENMNQAGEVLTLWAIAVLSGLLVRGEKRALRDVAETHEGSLVALVSALDAREHETRSHSLRVQTCALRLADELGLDEGEKAVLGQAALLHDVGKIGTPDGILLKPGPLDEGEWRIMREHPDAGFTIVSAVPFLRRAAEVIRCHHEHYDGSGYPRGLAGKSIPMPARVFSVIDTFDALTKTRPYRREMSCEEAREVIRDASGSQFDPDVVRAFLRIPCSEWTASVRGPDVLPATGETHGITT